MSTPITSPAEFLDTLALHMQGGEPCALFETYRCDEENSQSLLFVDPVDTVRFFAGDDPGRFFSTLEARLDAGQWAAGYFSYEFGYVLEPRLAPLLGTHRPETPLAWVAFYRKPLSGASSPEGADTGDEQPGVNNIELSLGRDDYVDVISQIKSHIVEGDTYQVNFTLKYRFTLDGSPVSLYRQLRNRQRVSYAACLHDGERSVVSISPELFFRRDASGIMARPMKGTVRRGRTAAEDTHLDDWIRNDPKNRAENVMIVDMIRNDLGRISTVGSVHTERLFELQRYETLFQMISTVRSQPRPDVSWREVMTALFPCASVTGAPKIRTMELIADLEREPRGVYTGAIGYFAPDGSAAFNVAIRTLVIDGEGKGEMGIGSGVVYDSDAGQEYDECLLKGRFLTEAPVSFALIETMRVKDGDIYLFEHHLRRLAASAHRFDFDVPGDLSVKLREIAAAHGDGRLRLLVDRSGGTEITVDPLTERQAPLRIAVAADNVDSSDPFYYHKTTHRPLYDRARAVAERAGIDDFVFLNERGEVTEATVFNVFVEIDGTLYTPPVEAGLLPGTLRQHLLQTGKCAERALSRQDLQRAGRILLGNSVRGLVEAVLVRSPHD